MPMILPWIFVSLGVAATAGCILNSPVTGTSMKVTEYSPHPESAARETETVSPESSSTGDSDPDRTPASSTSDSDPVATAQTPTPTPTPLPLPSHCQSQGTLLEAGTNWTSDLAGVSGQSATLIVRDPRALSQSLTIPGNVRVCFSTEGRIEIAADATLTLGAFDATASPILSGTGRVSFTDASPTQVLPVWFGARGDGTTDDATAFRRALQAMATVRGRSLNLEARTYALTLNPGLGVPDGNGIDGQGAVLLGRLTGDTEYPYMSDQRHFFRMGSDTFLRRLTLDNIPMARSAVSVLRHHIQVGSYETGRGVQNVVLEELTLKGGVDGEIGINVWGDSANVTIRKIKFPANPHLGTAIAVQWSWDPARLYDSSGALYKSWTGHPHDVVIDDVEIESMTGLGSSTDGQAIDLARSNCFDVCGNWGIWLSAPYNVQVKNVRMGTVATGVMAYAGDFGSYMADPDVKPLVGTGIVVENVTIEKALLRGFVVSGLPNYKDAGVANFSEYLDYVDMPVTFKNVRARGVGAAARVKNTAYLAGQGLLTYYTKGVWFADSVLEDFAYGMEVYDGVSLLFVEGSKIRRSSYGGISLVGSSRHRALNISIKTTEISDADMAQTRNYDAAAIAIGEYVDGVVIDACHITAYTPYYQSVGVYILGGNYHYLSNNWVSAVRAGGAGFGTKGGVTSKWYIRNNGANEGIPVYFGTPEYF